MSVENVKVEAMEVYYGDDLAQVEKIVVSPALTGASLAGKYFMLYTAALAKYAVWFNTGADTAPSLGDATNVEVAILAGDSSAQIAAKLALELNSMAGVYTAAASGSSVMVTHVANGYAPAAHDAKVLIKKTNLGFSLEVQGELEAHLGCVQGNIEVAFEESFLDVTCHASGVTPIAQLKNGVNSVEVTLNLQETTKEKIKSLFVKTGGSFIPDGGSEVFGMGTFKNFENMFKFASKLKLHPVRLLEGDTSEDWTFHKALPNLTGINFSGEEVQVLPITFKVYPAEGIDSRVNYFSIGDSAQSLA